MTGLDTARGLRLFAGQADIYYQALQDFVAFYGEGLPGAAVYLAEPSATALGQLRREVHSLGGAAAALGATTIEQLAQAFEVVLRNNQPGHPLAAGDPRALLASLSQQLATLIDDLRAQAPGA